MDDIMTTLIEEKNRQIADYRGLLELANARNDLLQKEINDLMQLLKYPDLFNEWRENRKPRILKLTEFKESMPVWFEEKDGDIYCVLIANCDGFDVRVLNNNKKYRIYFTDWLNDYYCIDWRCWSSRPTEEQRKAEPWNEGEKE